MSTDPPPGPFDHLLIRSELQKALPSFIASMNATTPSPSDTPLTLLQTLLTLFFKHGPNTAAFAFKELRTLAMSKVHGLTDDNRIILDLTTEDLGTGIWTKQYPWNSCKLAATLVMLFAAPRDGSVMFEAVKSQSGFLGGLPSLGEIRSTPSTSLSKIYGEAKKKARGKEGVTSVLQVTLTDVHIFELEQQRRSAEYFSFAHVFVLGIGPEGMVVWQGMGKHGRRLDEWIEGGGARVRSWEEADRWVVDFEKLVAGKGMWNAKRNKLYKKLFEVDILRVCNGKSEKLVTPKFEAWVRVQVVEDVKVEDVNKFYWA